MSDQYNTLGVTLLLMIAFNNIYFVKTYNFLLQIIFEALKGKSYAGDIALDDITITDGTCPPPGRQKNYSYKRIFCNDI